MELSSGPWPFREINKSLIFCQPLGPQCDQADLDALGMNINPDQVQSQAAVGSSAC